MKQPIFTGSAAAIVSPFNRETLDIPVLKRLLDFQLRSGTDAIVVCGTTGEASTMSYREKMRAIECCVEHIAGRVPVIAGSGANSTETAIALSRDAQRAGADALLVVTPYYNKCTQPGLVNHYEAIAGAVSLPVIAYNVPSRTGVDISVESCKALSRIPNLAGIKEACGDISKAGRILAECDLPVYSGNDDQTLALMALGGAGVISVASNVVPGPMNAMVKAAQAGDYGLAAALHRRLLPLMELLFCQVNPIPVKAAMHMIGFDCGSCRMPLDGLTGENEGKLRACLDGLGILAYNR